MNKSQENYLSGGADRSITIRISGTLHKALAVYASTMAFSSLSKAIRSLLAAALGSSTEGLLPSSDGSLSSGDQ
jgi:hypothetical protein